MSDTEQAIVNPEQEVEIGNYKIIELTKQNIEQQKQEEVLFKARSKLYLWDKAGSEWKERGIGNVSIVKDEATKKVKVVHVQEQTFKLRAFFYVQGENLGAIKKMEQVKNAFCFTCIDYSEDISKPTI